MKQHHSHRMYATGLNEHEQGTTVFFVCSAGHKSRHTYPREGPRSVSVLWLRRVASPGGYWTKDRGGCYGKCLACERAARAKNERK